jgi:hypothetical protein
MTEQERADLTARADRVRAIAENVAHGKVISREGDAMIVEVPADMSIGLNALWGQSGFSAIVIGQSTCLAPRRVTSMNGNTIVCDGDLVTTAMYHLRVDLTPRKSGTAAPSVAEITRQT